MRDGVTLQGADESRAAVADSLSWCLEHSLPVWRKLGVIQRPASRKKRSISRVASGPRGSV
ncbi:hypothetical protein M2351_008971 [Azospirillum canadense]|nr:hypothetical protein [Azospirillum canadense]